MGVTALGEDGACCAFRGIIAIAGYTMACYGMLLIIDSEMMSGGGDWWGFN